MVPSRNQRPGCSAPADPSVTVDRRVVDDPVHDPEGRVDGLGEVQVRGVEGDHAVGGLGEVHHGGVLRVPGRDLRRELFGALAAAELDAAAAEACLLAGGEQYAYLGVGCDDGGDVPSLDHHAAVVLFDQLALPADQFSPRAQRGGDGADCRGNGGFTDGDSDIVPADADVLFLRARADFQRQGLCGGLDGGPVVQVCAALQAEPCQGAVHRAGVEVGQFQPAGHLFAHAGFAGAGGAVDGNHKAFSGADYVHCLDEFLGHYWSTRHPRSLRAAIKRSCLLGRTEISTMPTFCPEEWSRRRSSTLTPISPISVSSLAICPGVSSTSTVSHEYACGGPPCLHGIRDWPALPSLISWARSSRAPGAAGDSRVPISRLRSSRTPCRISTTFSAFAPRIWTQSVGSLAAIRVTSRSPLPARDRACRGVRCRRLATSEDITCGRCE